MKCQYDTYHTVESPSLPGDDGIYHPFMTIWRYPLFTNRSVWVRPSVSAPWITRLSPWASWYAFNTANDSANFSCIVAILVYFAPLLLVYFALLTLVYFVLLILVFDAAKIRIFFYFNNIFTVKSNKNALLFCCRNPIIAVVFISLFCLATISFCRCKNTLALITSPQISPSHRCLPPWPARNKSPFPIQPRKWFQLSNL